MNLLFAHLQVFHIHDPRPADKLFVKEARRGVSPGRKGKGKDFRGYDFPEGDFPASGKAVRLVAVWRVACFAVCFLCYVFCVVWCVYCGSWCFSALCALCVLAFAVHFFFVALFFGVVVPVAEACVVAGMSPSQPPPPSSTLSPSLG